MTFAEGSLLVFWALSPFCFGFATAAHPLTGIKLDDVKHRQAIAVVANFLGILFAVAFFLTSRWIPNPCR